MSPSDLVSSPNAKTKNKEKEKKAKAVNKSQAERLKTVVRRLPPNLPEDVFWQSVQKWVTEETIQWKAYYQGKFRKRLNKENIPSRAYIAFKDEELLAVFSREYDGHLFRDKAGNESIAVVEFAPFQKIPSDKKKVDSRMGTIEKDEDYISFLQSLKDASTKPGDADNLESLIAAAQPPPQPTTTPLLEALKAEKSAQKDKEAILRNHAHYKDQSNAPGASSSKKDDGKKKGGAAVAAAQKPTEPQVSKKAAKKAAAAAKAAQQQQTQQAPPANLPAKPAAGAPAPKQAQSTAVPKTPRPPRERQQPKPAAGPPVPANLAAPALMPSGDQLVSGPAEVAQPARRNRPMLGLASRQFEAALSEAGVERRARREKEREKERAAPGDNHSNGGDSPAKGKAKDEKRSGAASAPRPPPPPMILQRDGQQQAPKVLARQGDGGPTTAQPDLLALEDNTSGGRGGGRIRGRGRGRGGMRGGG
ncbi:hypothetical protein AcW1_002568 [Taiwanofungus camphoratus]|nr:hypothetical protein AcV5_009777 [Antrodia cinnamomea]KAI0942772.1 hypothetical protein AcV7_002086 [Antrodia cinnamomea]KAI0943396.1 hypothetical protein AcW1_002568 [Antrodia cinnamomea]